MSQTLLQQSIEIRAFYVNSGYVKTNLGWLLPEWIAKGVEWGSIAQAGSDHFSYKDVYSVVLTKGADRFLRLNVFLAYIEGKRGNKRWFAQLQTPEQLAEFKRLVSATMSIPADYDKEIMDYQLSRLEKKSDL